MPIASRIKWFYGAYVTQQRGGNLSADDVRFLTFSSGYVTFDNACARDDTVGSCAVAAAINYTPAADGKFFITAATCRRMRHAAMALGCSLKNAGLADAMLGTPA